ncbi:MAG TPA: hypothetical protein DD861_05840 [Erythrobacter sp.]|nr:hypothetical protein [Erythrobacter sp.]
MANLISERRNVSELHELVGSLCQDFKSFVHGFKNFLNFSQSWLVHHPCQALKLPNIDSSGRAAVRAINVAKIDLDVERLQRTNLLFVSIAEKFETDTENCHDFLPRWERVDRCRAIARRHQNVMRIEVFLIAIDAESHIPRQPHADISKDDVDRTVAILVRHKIRNDLWLFSCLA